MTSDYFGEAINHYSPSLEGDFVEFLNSSPNNANTRSQTSPAASIASSSVRDQVPHRGPHRVLPSSVESDPEEDEDGLHSGETTTQAEGEDEDGSFGDGEHVNIASDVYRWKIDHSKGNHRLKGK
jgi:hypothetical protein